MSTLTIRLPDDTAQRLRSRLECAEDASKVAAAVEEMEFFVGRAPVPRPPEAW